MVRFSPPSRALALSRLCDKFKSMKIVNSNAESVPVSELNPHPKNPRQGDIGAIADSIATNGWYGTVVAQKGTNFILAGNHRWQAAQQLGMTEVPVTWVDVDDETALRILIADNRTSDLAGHDEQALASLLQELASQDNALSGTGWDADDLDNLLKELSTEMGNTPSLNNSLSDKLAIFENADTMSVMLILAKKEFAFVVSTLKEMIDRDPALESNSDAVLKLVNEWSQQNQK